MGLLVLEREYHPMHPQHRWHWLEARPALAFIQFIDNVAHPDLKLSAAISPHDLVRTGHAAALADGWIPCDTQFNRFADGQVMAAHLGKGGLERTEQTAAHVVGADVQAPLLRAVLNTDHPGGFSGGVGEDVAENFLRQPFQGGDEVCGVVDGSQSDGADGIDSLELLFFRGDWRQQ